MSVAIKLESHDIRVVEADWADMMNDVVIQTVITRNFNTEQTNMAAGNGSVCS